MTWLDFCIGSGFSNRAVRGSLKLPFRACATRQDACARHPASRSRPARGRIWAPPTSPGTCELAIENIRRANVPTPDAIDAPRRGDGARRREGRVLGQGGDYFGPSPAPSRRPSFGLISGLRESNSALRMASPC